MKVRELETSLFSCLPKMWAEPWDKVGLSVGDPDAEVTKIALALDALAGNVRAAHAAGANVLLTHHPVCLSMPDALTPPSSGAGFASSCLWEAMRLGVAILSFHTNLDRCEAARAAMPARLGFAPQSGGLESDRPESLGRLGACVSLPSGITLRELARSCKDALGDVAQAYGPLDSTRTRAAFFTGSLGDCGHYALEAGCDVVVCGECGYHKALELLTHGCAVIVLGHDVSELPLVGVLNDVLDSFGVPEDARVVLCEDSHWSSI